MHQQMSMPNITLINILRGHNFIYKKIKGKSPNWIVHVEWIYQQ